MLFNMFLRIRPLRLHFFKLLVFLCHPERSEGSRVHKVGIHEILLLYGRPNAKYYCIFASVFARN